jgi:hypothetical protein
MTYSASHAYPAAVGIAVLASFCSREYKQLYGRITAKTIALLLGAMAAGFLLTFGSQIVFVILHGFPANSRLNSQLVLNIIPKNLIQSGAIDWLGLVKFFWQHFLRTLLFFHDRDGAVQYGCYRGICETFSGILASLGALFIFLRACRLNSVSVLLLSTAILTIVGSSLMLEASFSPHFIVFTLLIPGAIAVGFDGVLQLLRIRKPLVASALAVACMIPWTIWNIDYIRDIDARKFNLNIWFLRFPLPTDQKFTMANATRMYADFSWPMYTLAFPNAKFVTISPERAVEDASRLALEGRPILVAIDETNESQYEQFLIKNNFTFQKTSHPKMQAKLFYVSN